MSYDFWLSPPDPNEEPYDLSFAKLCALWLPETSRYYLSLREKWERMDFEIYRAKQAGDHALCARCAFEAARLRAILFDLETMIFELWCRSEYFVCAIELRFVPDSTV